MEPFNKIAVIDECVDCIDAITTRVIVCCVQFNQSQINEIESRLRLIQSKVAYEKKFHMSDIRNRAEQAYVMEEICKLPFTATVLIYYGKNKNQQQAKVEALKRILKEARRLMARQKVYYVVESSNEYKEIVKSCNLKDSKENILTFLPDTICYTYRLALNVAEGRDLYYKHARDKIRLEVRTMDGHITRHNRQFKL